jgi:Flp pilus assembly protein TadG
VRRTRNERGVALVEFALVLPFLAVLVFGTVDLGRSYQFMNKLRSAAREGAQVAQFNPENSDPGCKADPFNVKYKVLNEDPSIANLNPRITMVRTTAAGVSTTVYNSQSPTCTTAASFAAGDKITVNVQADFKLLTPLIGNIVGSPLRLTGSQSVDLQR